MKSFRQLLQAIGRLRNPARIYATVVIDPDREAVGQCRIGEHGLFDKERKAGCQPRRIRHRRIRQGRVRAKICGNPLGRTQVPLIRLERFLRTALHQLCFYEREICRTCLLAPTGSFRLRAQ